MSDPKLRADEYVGRTGLVRFRLNTEPGTQVLWAPFRVVAAREKFGRVYLQVTPVNGHGLHWIESCRIKFAG
jgi:hypothetical protein